jgi:hypothetical protein
MPATKGAFPLFESRNPRSKIQFIAPVTVPLKQQIFRRELLKQPAQDVELRVPIALRPRDISTASIRFQNFAVRIPFATAVAERGQVFPQFSIPTLSELLVTANDFLSVLRRKKNT